MSAILRKTPQTWQPDADPVGAPADAILRADNLTLDEVGALSLRPGSAKVNNGAYGSLDVHSLFSVALGGTKRRFTGVSNNVFLDGVSTGTTFAGSDDIAFASGQGQVFYGRSTTKKKHDGTTERNWGIATPLNGPTVAAIASDGKTLASCDTAEATWTAEEGAIADAIGQAGAANTAKQITPDGVTGRGTVTRTLASATDYTVYDAGQAGSDNDLVDFYIYVSEPQLLIEYTIMIDVNGGNFQEDYYFFSGKFDQTIPVNDPESVLSSNYDVAASTRDRIIGDLARGNRTQVASAVRKDLGTAGTPIIGGWNHISIPRGSMIRSGATSGKDWATVKAVRFTFLATAGVTDSAMRIDNIAMVGGSSSGLIGRYKAAVVAVRNNGTYNALSAPSTFSAEIDLKAQGLRVAVAAADIDTQANELWAFVMGGDLPDFYLGKKFTGSISGTVNIDIPLSDVTILILNVPMQRDNAVPPDSPVFIEGPHYDRLMVLTAAFLYPSRRLNPESFSTGQAVRVGSNDETAYWVKKVNQELYVGTSKDIYRLAGDWSEFPDGSVNVIKIPMGVANPPIGAAVATEGRGDTTILVYLSSSGWRLLSGQLLVGMTSLLWRGQARHGVSAINVSGATARFRCAIAKGILYAITPEGSSTTSSAAVYRYSLARQDWERFVYPQAFRSIFREPDGTILTGDAAGFVRAIDLAAHTDDGATIAVTIRTPFLGGETPAEQKEWKVYRLRLDTGGSTLTSGLYLDGGTAVGSVAPALSSNGVGLVEADISALAQGEDIQFQMSGSFSTFRLYEFGCFYVAAPAKTLVFDTGNMDLGWHDLSWMRWIEARVRSTVALTVTPYFDGVASTASTIAAGSDVWRTVKVFLGREFKGRTPRFVLTGASPFQCEWIKPVFRGSGNTTGKQRAKVGNRA